LASRQSETPTPMPPWIIVGRFIDPVLHVELVCFTKL
jgi:hypothetical protein